MKKWMVIGAVALCTMLIGGTVIASETFGSKEGASAKTVVKQEVSAASAAKAKDVESDVPEDKVLATTPVEEQEEEANVEQETSSEVADEPQQEEANVQQQEVTPDSTAEAQVETPVIQQEASPAPTVQPQVDSSNVAVPETNAQTSYYQGTCPFVDENHDGFCDYGDVHYHNGSHMDANYDGFCDYGDHYCMQGYVDADGNGVCDNYQTSHGAHHSYSNNSSSSSGSANSNGNTSSSTGYGYHHSSGHHGGRHHR